MLFKFGAGRESKKDERKSAWNEEINETLKQMQLNEQLFNMTDDFDMTEYAIYQRIALNMRYKYLLDRVRESKEDGRLIAAPASKAGSTGG